MGRRIAGYALAILALAAGCAPGRRSAVLHVADGTVVETTDSSFVADVILPRRPTVVYYWAQTCIPCYLLGPRIRKLAPRYVDRVTFWKLDMGWSAARVQRYGIGGWPALAFYLGDRRLRVIAGPEGHVDDSLAAFVDEGLRLAALPDSAVPSAKPALR